MNIAYLNPFNDGTGYANAGIRTMLAMDAVGINVFPIETKFANQIVLAPNRIQQLAGQEVPDNIDIVVQHILPPAFTYVSGAKNVGYFHVETTDFLASTWQYYANLLDEVWVSCEQNAEACLRSGIKVPIHVVPIGQDLSFYDKEYKRLHLPNDKAFTFYSISDWSERKNVESVIKAYLCEFSDYDNVRLILKCYVDATGAAESKEIISKRINEIKTELRRFSDHSKYPPIYLIPEYLSDEHIHQLHATGDCCVFGEKGAAWNLVAFDAVAHGNSLVINGWGGHTEFTNLFDEETGVYPVGYQMERVSNMQHCPYKTLYTCNESWANPSINDMIINMRAAYDSYNQYEKRDMMKDNLKKLRGPVLKDHLSLESVGNKIKDFING